MGYLPLYVLGVVGCVLLLDTAYAALRWAVSGKAPWPFTGLARRIDAFQDARKPRPEPMPSPLLGLELRRLGGEMRRIAESDLPAKHLRMQAVCAAYDDVLLKICRAEGVPEPEPARVPLTDGQRFEAESALVSSGFSW